MAPNVNTHDLGKSVLVMAVMWAQYALCFILTMVRYAITGKITRAGFGLDDHFLWLNLVFFLGYVGFCTHAALNGFGRHQWDLSNDQFVNANFYENIGQASAAIALFFSKSTVAFFLLRIIVNKWQKLAIYIAIAIQAIVTTLCCILLFTQISPVEGVWNPFLTKKTVNFDFVPFAIFYAVVSMMYDFFLGIAPWIFLANLNMKPKERYTICASLSLGISAGIFAMIRAIRVSSLGAKADYSYETVEVILWSSSEITASCISICIPPLRALYRRYRKNGSSSGPSNGKSYGQSSAKYGYRLEPINDSKRSYNDTSSQKMSLPTEHRNDSDSDKSILGQDFRVHGIGGIKTTHEVTVDYVQDEESGNSNGGFGHHNSIRH